MAAVVSVSVGAGLRGDCRLSLTVVREATRSGCASTDVSNATATGARTRWSTTGGPGGCPGGRSVSPVPSSTSPSVRLPSRGGAALSRPSAAMAVTLFPALGNDVLGQLDGRFVGYQCG